MSRIPTPSAAQPGTAPAAVPQRTRTWLLWTLPPLVLLAAAWGIAQATLPAGWLPQALHTIGEGLQTRGFWTAAAVGLAAQIVDGALGMAYGVTSTTFLLSTGVPPAAASASVHIAEIFTTGFSGLSHFKLGNVNKALFKRLLIPGVAGGLIGAYIVTSVDANTIKPFISAYLLLIGLYILSKVWRQLRVQTEPPKYVAPLALTGGFVDAVGGGGWGPVVTTSLIGGGHDPRTTIGSVNAAEFFIALATGLSFSMLGGLTHWTTIAGLVFGGLFAAPFAAVLTRHAPTKLLLAIVGVLISALSAYNLYKLF
ncbi:TSUP family transporter [Pseudorhodoferax sp. LjRoot39]|uniref:sulfite exporter TauE/SafE family protein n=1 Tax=Pseudorhodoferax sp. LjRoot39 TaxID=3342328 RepID=UPI003ECF1318